MEFKDDSNISLLITTAIKVKDYDVFHFCLCNLGTFALLIIEMALKCPDWQRFGTGFEFGYNHQVNNSHDIFTVGRP